MKDYELSVLFHPDLEMNLDPSIAKLKKLLESNGAKITKEEPEGKKRLSYSIDGQDFAIYYYFDVQMPAEAPAKISSTLNISDEVIRFLLVKSDPRKAKYAARRQARESEETEEKEGEEA